MKTYGPSLLIEFLHRQPAFTKNFLVLKLGMKALLLTELGTSQDMEETPSFIGDRRFLEEVKTAHHTPSWG